MNTKRIELAKLIGWKWEPRDNPFRDTFDGGIWIDPNPDTDLSDELKTIVGCKVPPPFDPFTDANDCEALIRHLTELDWTYQIQGSKQSVAVFIWREDSDGEIEDYAYRGDDWKQGVCELALKALESVPNKSATVEDTGK